MAEENVAEFALALEAGPAYDEMLAEYRALLLALVPEDVAVRPRPVRGPRERRGRRGHDARERRAPPRQHGRTGSRPGVGGWRDDDQAFLRAWGFDVAADHVPVGVWFGDQDLMVPARHGEWLARERARARRCRRFPDDGHLSFVVGRLGDAPRRARRARGWPVVRIGNLYGPDATFLGVPAADLDDAGELGEAAGGHRRRAVRRRHLAPRRVPVRPARDPHDRLPPPRRRAAAPRPRRRPARSSSASSTSATSRCPRGRSSARSRALEEAVATIAAAAGHPGRPRRRPHHRAARRHRRRAPRRLRATSACCTSTPTPTPATPSSARSTATARRCAGSSSRARAAATASCRSGCAATGPSPRRSRGWPTSRCAASR